MFKIKIARIFLFIFGIFMFYIIPLIGLLCLILFVVSFIIYKRNEKMTEDKAVKIITNKFGLELHDKNTHWSENFGDVWTLKMYINSKNINSYIILNNNKTKKIHVFEIKANDEIYNKLFGGNYYSLAFFLNDSTFVENFSLTNFKKFHIGTIKY